MFHMWPVSGNLVEPGSMRLFHLLVGACSTRLVVMSLSCQLLVCVSYIITGAS